MGKKGKKKQQVPTVVQENIPSSEDDGPTPLKKRRVLRPVSESESEGEDLSNSKKRNTRKRKPDEPNIRESTKKRKMTRCADSSDEENVENSSVSTPKADRINKLQEMRKKIQAKKKISYISSNEESSDEDRKWLVEDEDNLPAWENEEVPPDEKEEASENDDLSDFIIDDESSHEPGVKQKHKRKKKPEEVNEEVDALSEAEEKLIKLSIINKKRKPTNKNVKQPPIKADDQSSVSVDNEESESDEKSEEDG